MDSDDDESDNNSPNDTTTRSTTTADRDDGATLDILNNDDDDTLRILISTDNHLGYAERDPVRGNDSFAAFEEVLYIGKRYHCDMILFAGDLFHDNRPSRRTLYKTMEIIRRYCMGSNPVRIQILSNQLENFRNTVTGVVNYQDPYYSIDLPIFSIHGNHDDPSRDSGGGLLAALDLLAVSNLVNYWGVQNQVDRIEISPIIIQKGITKVALYGLGSMRDERLNRMWENKKVRFLRPEEDTTTEEGDDEGEGDDTNFFNIFTLHQNRDLGRGGKNCIQESMIPEWMDLVIWGHEHECLIEFFESVVGTFRITQPGSSVATSLVSGEAARKKVGILDINGKNFRLHPVPLTQVRSFVTTEISLKEHRSGLDPDDPKIEMKVTQVLEEEVHLMIRNARQKTKELIIDALAAGNDAGCNKNSNIKYTIEKPDEVLVRVRVEHMGFSTLNNQRFGAKFVSEIANPGDILLFHRKKDMKLSSTATKKSILPIPPDELEKTNMEDLVKEQLEAPDKQLKLLEEHELSEAMENYVEKSLVGAIPDKAHSLLKKKQMKLIKSSGSHQLETNETNKVDSKSQQHKHDESYHNDLEDSRRESIMDVDDSMEHGSKKRKVIETTINESEEEEEVEENDYRDVPSRRTSSNNKPLAAAVAKKSTTTTRTTSAAATKHKTSSRNVVDIMDDEDDDDISPPTKKRLPQRRTNNNKKMNYSDDRSIEAEDNIDEDSDDDVVVVSKNNKKPAAAKVTSTTSRTTTRQKNTPPSQRKTSTTGTATKRAPVKKTTTKLDDSDEDDGVDNNNDDLDDDWGTAVNENRRFR